MSWIDQPAPTISGRSPADILTLTPRPQNGQKRSKKVLNDATWAFLDAAREERGNPRPDRDRNRKT
jgi:hypothetical protein